MARARRAITAIAVIAVIAALAGAAACSAAPPPAVAGPSGEDAGTDVAAPPCPAGTWVDGDGSCVAAGVPAAACAPGFAPDGDDGCTAIGPAVPCPDGQVAWLGETVCHEIADCGDGAWGAIPIEANTVFVDAAYAGADGDGTRAKPWPTIQDGIDHAPYGAIVAVAAGTYVESLAVTRRVRLWGRCPSLVTLAANGPLLGTVPAVLATDDLELHALRVSTNAQVGIWVRSGPPTASLILDGADISAMETALAVDVDAFARVTRSIIHGDIAMTSFRPTELTITSSILRSAPRGSRALSGSPTGTVSLSGTIIEGVPDGLHLEGDAVISGCLFRDVDSSAIEVDVLDGIPRVAVVGSVIERTAQAAIVIGTRPINAALVRVATTTIRDTGIEGAIDAHGNVALDVDRVRIARPTGYGLNLNDGIDARIRGLRLTDVAANVAANGAGDGSGYGVLVYATVLADGSPPPPTSATIDGSVVDGTIGAGLIVVDATVGASGTAFRRAARLPDGSLGDGIAVVHDARVASIDVENGEISACARAGLSTFGATATIGATRFEDDAIDLDTEAASGVSGTFVDRGANACVSGGVAHACIALSAGLSPPPALGAP